MSKRVARVGRHAAAKAYRELRYGWFVKAVTDGGFTVEQVRFDVPPPGGVMEVFEQFEDVYETFALRWVSEQTGQ
jgi:hypothetical protein